MTKLEINLITVAGKTITEVLNSDRNQQIASERAKETESLKSFDLVVRQNV